MAQNRKIDDTHFGTMTWVGRNELILAALLTQMGT